jgi:hypothetical protein
MKGFKPYMMMIREVLKILNPNAFHKQVCTILESYIGLSKSRESWEEKNFWKRCHLLLRYGTLSTKIERG